MTPARTFRWGHRANRVAFIGATSKAARLINKLRSNRSCRVELVGIFDDRLSRRPSNAFDLAVHGSVEDLIAYARTNQVDQIVLALPASARARLEQHVERLRSLPVDIVIVDDNGGDGPDAPVPGQERFEWMAGEQIAVLLDRPLSPIGKAMKRTVDLLLACSVLLLAAPFMLLVAVAIALDSSGGALFRQQRIGFNNRPFTVLKFRTMTINGHHQDGATGVVQDDPRVTRLGHFLRRFSIDELPQLLNVVGGSMSIVGPRPQAVSMRIGDRRYAEAVAAYIERHRVKPGLTGWAQINGSRGGIYTLKKAAWAVTMDMHYVQNWSLWLDIRIMWRTVGMVVTGRDAF